MTDVRPEVGYPTLTMYRAMEQALPGITNYVVGGNWRGPLDHDRLAAALALVVRRHSMLTSVVELADPGADLQVDDPAALWTFVRGRPVEPATVEIHEGPPPTARTAREPFDYGKPPYLRLWVDDEVDGVRRLACLTTHVVFDGWSRNLLWRDLGRLYEDPEGEAAGPAPDYWTAVAQQHEEWAAGKWQRHLSAWERVAADMPQQSLPTATGKLSVWPLSKAVAFGLTPEAAGRITALVKQTGRTRFTVATALFFTAVSEVFGWDEVLATMVFANRTPANKEILGLFVNGVLLRVTAKGPVDDVVEGTWRAVLNGAAHGRVPFLLLRAEVPAVGEATRAQPPIMVRQQDLVTRHVAGPRQEGVEVGDRLIVPDRPRDPEAVERDSPAAQFGHESDLMFDCFLSEDEPLFRLTYRADRLDEATVLDLVRTFRAACGQGPA